MSLEVFGRVVVAETGSGIPGVVVAGIAHHNRDGRRAEYRFGSTVTSTGGAFRFAPSTDEDERRSDELGTIEVLELIVTAASGADRDDPVELARVRRGEVGRVEAFRIDIATAVLQDCGQMPIDPLAQRDNEFQRDRDRSERLRRAAHDEQTARVREGLQVRRERAETVDRHFSQFRSALSGVTEEVRASPAFVEANGPVFQTANGLIGAELRSGVNKPAHGYLMLTEEQAVEFQVMADGTLPLHLNEELEAKLHNAALFPELQWDPKLNCSKSLPADDGCISKLTGDSSDNSSATSAGENMDLDETDKPNSAAGPVTVTSMVQALTSDLAVTGSSIGGKSAFEQVQASVDAFALQKGPADVPAIYEFNSLQIAFSPVWTELFDEKLLVHGRTIYEDLVELGEDPNEYLVQGNDIVLGPAKKLALMAVEDPVPEILEVFEVDPEAWVALTEPERIELCRLAQKYLKLRDDSESQSGFSWDHPFADSESDREDRARRMAGLRASGLRLLIWAAKRGSSGDLLNRYSTTLTELAEALDEPYRFTIYAANRVERSVNFGIVSNFRQVWTPETYQVGKLLHTIPLAPKETRRYSKKVSQSRTRSRQEIDNHLSARRFESEETMRAETEIVQRALAKTNFTANAQGSFGLPGIASVSGGAAFGRDAETESNESKRQFREAIFKASEEYKAEHNVEVNSGSTDDFDADESGEISNPNDEITVTYLFYELQRRFKVTEQLNSVRPVVLVAQEVPRPDEINEAWILLHDWILRRVILDDSFVPALDYIATGMVGDEAALRELNITLQQRRTVVDKLKDDLVGLQRDSTQRYAALERSIEQHAATVDEEEEGGSILGDIVGTLVNPLGFGGGGGAPVSEAGQRLREDASRDAYDRAARKERDLLDQIANENVSLSQMTQKYSDALTKYLNKRVQINRLRVHLKSNILHYMQAIWTYEPPDQRYFRLHEVPVPRIKGKKTYKVVNDPDGKAMPPSWAKPKKVTMTTDVDPDALASDSLATVADLDTLLGFKGNYMIFPLRNGNDVTDLMTLPYVDPVLGLRDPDPAAGWTPAQFADYVCCLHKKLGAKKFAEQRPRLIEAYEEIMAADRTDGQTVVVPTGSLFIEALPGSHPVLEQFKLLHRATDVRRAVSDVRGTELENVRMAARLLAGERDDPNIDRKIVIEGGSGAIDVKPDDV